MVRTRHFTLTGAVEDSFLLRLGRQLEEFRNALALLIRDIRVDPGTPTWVVVFDTYQDYAAFAPQASGAYFTAGLDRNYIVLPRLAPRMDPLQVALHEYSHAVFVLQRRGRLPAWLSEGLSEFYSTFQLDPEGYSFALGVPPRGRVDDLRELGVADLNDLVNRDVWVRAWKGAESDAEPVRRLYATSWLLVHFLMLADNEAWKPQLQRYTELVCAGQTGRQAFDATLGPKVPELQRRLKEYVHGKTIPGMAYATTLSSADTGNNVSPAILPETDLHLIRAELQERSAGKGENHAKRALALEPGQAGALAVMGRWSMREDRDAEALGYFQKALQSDSSHLGARAGLAATLARQRRFADAAAAYDKLLSGPVGWLRPDLLNQLGLIWLRAGDPAAAANSFKEASALVEDDSDMLRSRAYVQLGLGNGAAAAEAARACLEHESLADEHRPYLAIVAFLGARMADQGDADSELQRLRPGRTEDWPVPVCECLLGRMDETKVFRAAGSDRDRLTEAHAYIGLKVLIGGRRDEALAHLKWVVQSGNRRFIEYPLAQDTLERLNDTVRR